MPLDYLIKESLQSLRENPLRSALSIIGVIFGVASVVAMLGIGMGTEREIEKLLSSLGINNIHVVSKKLNDTDWQQAVRSTVGLSDKDERVMQELYPTSDIAHVAAWNDVDADEIRPGAAMTVYGVSANFRRILGTKLVAGRFFTDVEENLAMPLALIPEHYAVRVYGSAAKALQQKLQIGDQTFQIVGVFPTTETAAASNKPAENSNGNADKNPEKQPSADDLMSSLALDHAAILPFYSAVERVGPLSLIAPLERVIVHLPDEYDPIAVAKRIDQNLRRIHRNVDVVTVASAKEVIEKKRATSRLFTYFLLVIAFIAIIVGAIGIANVMIASMVERIHEVGLRRAIGAKQRDIFVQFIAEALFICLVGGAVGGLLGLLVSLIIGAMMGWVIVIPWWGLLVALLISSLVGIAAGLYPAVVAARISPIEALLGRRD